MTRLTDEELDITTADMLEIVASGGNGSELVELPAIMSKAAKELREKGALIAELLEWRQESLDKTFAQRSRIAELEAALEKAKETADAEFTAKLRYRDERMAAEAEVKRLREALAGVLPPSHGLYGGPLVQMVARYEDSTDETSARHKGTISHEAVARARAALGREG
jgi:hypothetical protein